MSSSNPQRTNLSRDEMNLCEFPISILATRANPNLKTLTFQDQVLVQGKSVKRSWIITGADKFGLPTSSDEEILLGLLKLTVESGLNNRRVYFTRYELLKTLKWSIEGRNYTRLQKGLDRLAGVRIKATNAFYDNIDKIHCTKLFGILDSYEIVSKSGKEQQTSFFEWSEVLFTSFQSGFIKKMDLDYYLSLSSAISRRLFRYLDKHFWYRNKVAVNTLNFAHEKIGISRNFKYASALKQQLTPALEELKATGFLLNFEFVGQGRKSSLEMVSANCKSLKTPMSNSQTGIPGVKFEEVLQKLIDRGIKKPQARLVLPNCLDDAEYDRIEEIVEYFDTLVATGSRLVSLNPIGFLYKAIERFRSFKLPREYTAKTAQKKQVVNAKPELKLEEEHQGNEKNREKSKRGLNVPQEELLERARLEVSKRLSKIKALISDERYQEVLDYGIKTKLQELESLDMP